MLESYSPNITLLFQPDQSEPEVPPKEKKFKGYFKISRHYGWALGQVGALGFLERCGATRFLSITSITGVWSTWISPGGGGGG